MEGKRVGVSGGVTYLLSLPRLTCLRLFVGLESRLASMLELWLAVGLTALCWLVTRCAALIKSMVSSSIVSRSIESSPGVKEEMEI